MLKNVSHPGQVLLSEITKLGMSQKELALRTGVSEKHISTVINGVKDISSTFGRKLDIALGSKKGYWAKLQSEYDQYQLALGAENDISSDEIAVLSQLKEVMSTFLKKGYIHNDCGDTQKVLQMREVLRVNDLTVIPQITYSAAYRAQIKGSTNINPFVLFAWQRMCELETEKANSKSCFNVELLRDSIPSIKQTMFEADINNAVSNLKQIFANCGVSFEVVEHFRGAPVQGFIKQTDKDKVILCLTIRGKKADRFWFSLFHEIGHLINGDLNVRFVDFDSVKSETEAAADKFARNTLIDDSMYSAFVQANKYHNLHDIKEFSNKAGVPHWITIGRLHNDEWLDWSYFASEIPSYEWID